ncbi:MAG: carboxypeptidase regulatory-like domain-containing protein [Planctomycetia bacterium]|nr:carboxypeptidase regulatory-like domain-containing protein [Planctomycetia bacterium]
MARPRWAGSGEVSVVAPRADVVVVVHPTVALHGRVVGGSVQGIALWNPAEGNPGPRAPLDADGRFALRGLPPRPGLLYITDGVGDRYVLVDRVSPGEAPLELAWSDGAAIEGRVVGLPAQTSVGIEAVAGAFTAGASTSVDGTFRIRALPPGRYRLRLAGSYRGGSEDVAAGTSGVLVTAVSR